MKHRQLAALFVLLLALAGCSKETPQKTPAKVSTSSTTEAQKATITKNEAEKKAALPAQTAPPAATQVNKEKVAATGNSPGQKKTSFDPFKGIIEGAHSKEEAIQGANVVIGQENPTQGTEIAGDVELNMTAGSVQAVNVVTAMSADGDESMLISPSSPPMPLNTESYNQLKENSFLRPTANPYSTFSVDVDTASYSNVRRFINAGQMPPAGAVRIEELINYFTYSYPQPVSEHPFSVTTELGPCPWEDSHKLVRIGLKAKDIDKKELPPSNLVFLIDVSGSMADPNKLPLLQQGMKLLVRQLNEKDRVAMVVYAGNEHVVLEPTPGSEQQKIIEAIDSLGAGGSTHASSGIITAYQLAEQAFMPGGNNRIILASDGDFNVGVTSPDELKKMIEEKRKSGVYLTVLGFGMGNYHDDTMEVLADKGNGNYAYIDNLLEAKKVMVKEMSGTLFALAKDVKIQVEFNPTKVGAYRLIGYENRALADEDFNDDKKDAKKDAGEIGIGHTVTALYELIPIGAMPAVDPLKYQKKAEKPDEKTGSTYANELMTVKLRYKPLQSEKSVLLDTVVQDRDVLLNNTSEDFRFAAAVAGYGMLLIGTEQKGTLNWPQVLTLAKGAKGQDEEGYRAEFIRLVEATELLAK
ncbi:vWA domain-containing protein [Candidatus Electronema sp. PJ]|uniref:vWA domain-containing protein n=1 Tax=Candidatus Electronema sp. PJ TaxID=3401572 RepID=UPI003AA7BA1E